jgi:hypothetical protein
MRTLTLSDQSLQLLNAQVNLSGTFNHTLRSAERPALPFRLIVDREAQSTAFIVEIGEQRHSIVLRNGKATHGELVDFITEIANGCVEPIRLEPSGAKLNADLREQVFDVIGRGGAMTLEVGLELPINVAVHRNRTRSAVTTIMSIGVKRPRTKCFTVCGSDAEIYEKVAESLNHLITVATPATEAA